MTRSLTSLSRLSSCLSEGLHKHGSSFHHGRDDAHPGFSQVCAAVGAGDDWRKRPLAWLTDEMAEQLMEDDLQVAWALPSRWPHSLQPMLCGSQVNTKPNIVTWVLWIYKQTNNKINKHGIITQANNLRLEFNLFPYLHCPMPDVNYPNWDADSVTNSTFAVFPMPNSAHSTALGLSNIQQSVACCMFKINVFISCRLNVDYRSATREAMGRLQGKDLTFMSLAWSTVCSHSPTSYWNSYEVFT